MTGSGGGGLNIGGFLSQLVGDVAKPQGFGRPGGNTGQPQGPATPTLGVPGRPLVGGGGGNPLTGLFSLFGFKPLFTGGVGGATTLPQRRPPVVGQPQGGVVGQGIRLESPLPTDKERSTLDNTPLEPNQVRR